MAAAIAVIGCAGGGDDSGGTSSTSTTSTTSGTAGTLRVNFPPPPTGQALPPGRLEVGFLSGQGRAIGDLTLKLQRLAVTDEFGEVQTDLPLPLYLSLSSYSFQILPLTIPFRDQFANSRLFESFTLDPTSVIVEGSTDEITCFGTRNPDGSFSKAWPPNPTPIEARVFPGRNTLMPVFLDDSMFTVESDPNPPFGDPCNGQIVVFDQNRFNEINQPPIKAFINDYVSFDISGVPAADRPTMSDGTLVARVFTTGDNYAVSGAGTRGDFELLTPDISSPIVGTYGPPGTIGGSTHPGTFTLEQLDPTDLFNLRKIVALQGIWREYNSVIAGMGEWNMVSFPTSQDGYEQEVVFFKRDGNAITAFYFGFLNYDSDQIHLFPVKTLVSGIVNPADEIVMTITGQFDKNGNTTNAAQLTRSGNFNVTINGSLAAGAPTTGSFLVFRA